MRKAVITESDSSDNLDVCKKVQPIISVISVALVPTPNVLFIGFPCVLLIYVKPQYIVYINPLL